MNDSSRQTPEILEANVIHLDALPQGTLLGEFEILGLLGVGGFGMVYAGYDHSLHRTVAIKEYMPAALASRAVGTALSVRSSVDQSTFSAGLTSFVAEARLLAQFDHPSLVKVYRFWEANNTAYMAMPLYQGMTLKQARGQMASPPPEAWLRQVLWAILGALKVLHENNLLHRDVSPDNIFLQNVGPPVLLDLGSARRAVLDANKKHTAVLKVNYAPIEQYAQAVDLPQGPWTDLYALAAVVHGCLCNEPPLPATFRVVADRLPPIARVALTVQQHFGRAYSAGFVAAVGHALAIQPGDRPQNIEAFTQEMQLGPPGDMLKFDWRAGLDLGAGGVDGFRSHGAEPSEPTIRATIDPDAEVEPVAVAPSAPETHRPASTLGVVLLMALLLVASWLFWRDRPNPLVADATRSAAMVASAAPATSPPKVAEPATVPAQPTPIQPLAARVPGTAEARMPRRAAASTAHGPVALCADRNFLTRPLCIYQACQKPQFAQLAVCIEERQRAARRRDERLDP